jgi:hypothetical protein
LFRGSLVTSSAVYAAFTDQVVKFSSSGGASTAVDGLDGEDRVFFAKNNKRPTPDVVMVCGAGAFKMVSDVISDLSDVDLPSAIDVCFLDGYFFFIINDGRCFSSGLNDITINANDFITAEAKSDTLLRGIPWVGQLWLFGSTSIEVWAGQPVNDTGFPFNRIAVVQRGLAGQGAVAGYEDGFGKALLWVGDDNAVHMAAGYTPQKVSTPDLERLIAAVEYKDTLNASVYISGGHAIWALSSDNWTWEFSLNTQKWNERKSYLTTRWRGSRSFNAFGKWLCGDTESGNIIEIDGTTKTEVGEPLIAECWSAPVHNFPNRIRVARVDIDLSTGVGILTGIDPNETDPEIEVSHSDDGGYSFTQPRKRKIGQQGKPLKRVTLYNNGISGAQGRIYKITMSDPAHFGLMGGEMSAELRVG